MKVGQLVRELQAAGIEGEALAAAIDRIFSHDERHEPSHVTPGALRTRRYRERHKASPSVTSDVTVTESDTAPTPPSIINIKNKTTREASQCDAQFDEWYAVYPLKKSRGAALKAFKAAIKKTSADVLIAAARAYAAQQVGVEPKYVKHPASWLNGECWMDADLVPARPVIATNPKVRVEYDTPQGEAWTAYFKTRGKIPPKDHNNGWYFDTEYPPQEVAA